MTVIIENQNPALTQAGKGLYELMSRSADQHGKRVKRVDDWTIQSSRDSGDEGQKNTANHVLRSCDLLMGIEESRASLECAQTR
jgi:hypothetical protein